MGRGDGRDDGDGHRSDEAGREVVKGLDRAVRAPEFVGQLGPDAPDGVGGEVGQDLDAGLGHEPLQGRDLQLLAVGAVGAPTPLDPQPLAHLGVRYGADHGGRLALGVLEPQDGVAVLRILKHHGRHAALDPHQFFHENAPCCFVVLFNLLYKKNPLLHSPFFQKSKIICAQKAKKTCAALNVPQCTPGSRSSRLTNMFNIT